VWNQVQGKKQPITNPKNLQWSTTKRHGLWRTPSWIVMNPIWCWMKKCSPSSGQNDQLVHWWLLVHSNLIFSFHNKTPLLLLFCYFRNRPTQFLVLFSYSKKIDPIYLLIPSLTYLVLDLIVFLNFLVTINPITCLLASLTHNRSDYFIPTRWLEGSKFQTSKLSPLWQLNRFLI